VFLTLVTATLILTAAAYAKAPSIQYRTSQEIVATWTCEDQRQIPRTKAASPWKPHTAAYRRAQLNLWTLKRKTCLQALHAHDAILRKLRRGLAGTPMAGTEAALEAAGRRWHIHPAFIAAIAGTESSFGAAACSGNPRNAYGLSSCTTGWAVPYFNSWAASYEFMGRFLTSRWPGATTPYSYRGYAACSDCWGRSVSGHMARFGVGNSVVYP
jgi:hypothetical protein